jgi:hypothetical protein
MSANKELGHDASRRIVVAADEVERREAGVFHGGRWQVRAQEGREVEGGTGHGVLTDVERNRKRMDECGGHL